MSRQFSGFKSKLILALLTCCGFCFLGVSAEDEEQPQLDPKIQNDVNNEVAFREKIEVSADADADAARRAFEADRYKEAVDFYNSAIDKLKQASISSPHVEEKINAAKRNMAMVYHYWARSLAAKAREKADQKKFDVAISYCIEAMKMDPAMTQSMTSLVKRFKKQRKVAVYRSDTSEDVVDPNRKERLYKIDVLMAQGRTLYNESLWHRARDKFESVLLLDPYNEDATLMIKKLNKEMYKTGIRRYKDTSQERNAEVTWKYVAPLIPRSLAASMEKKPVRKKMVNSKIEQKLEDIIIKHMEFEDATIDAVVNRLRFQAKEEDPEKEGVNIVLRLNAPETAADASATDGSAATAGGEFLLDEGDGGGAADGASDTPAADGGASGGGGQTITIMFDDLPLGAAIKNICMAANMKWRIEEYAVVIAAKGVPLDQLETRIYPINSEAATSWTSGGDAGDGAGTASVQAFFEKNGVAFPEGAKIVYDSAISRIIATNVPAQLERIERIIHELDVVDPQVLIEAKFVEIRERKTDELGFGWTVSRTNTTPIAGIDGKTYPNTHVSNRPRTKTFQPNDQPLTFFNQVTDPIGGNDTAFDIQHVNGNGVNTRMTVHALDLENNTNILSCPRITTLNGEEATIRMVTEQYFPESWGEAQLAEMGGVTGSVYISSMPEFGEPTELGVRLTVTPTVDPDRYTITLDMVPVVQTHVGWTDYSYEQITSSGTVQNILRMPIIEARTVETQLTIYDGETVVLGGIMRDNTSYIDDRIPILGDLPLVGRFFRSKGVNAQKNNLLIFTTPRLVNPNGAPLRQREVRGKPPFRM